LSLGAFVPAWIRLGLWPFGGRVCFVGALGIALALAVLPALASAQIPVDLVGRPVLLVDVEGEGAEGLDGEDIGFPTGVPLTRALLRRVTEDLIATGRWADVRIDVAPHGEGARARVLLERRTVIARIDVLGNHALSGSDLSAAIALSPGEEIVGGRTDPVRDALTAAYHELGYDRVEVEVTLRDTTQAERRVLRIVVTENAPTRIAAIRFLPEAPPRDVDAEGALGLGIGAILDRRRLEPGVRALEASLRDHGFLEARVGDVTLEPMPDGVDGEPRVTLVVPCRIERRYRVVVDGAAPLTRGDVESVLSLGAERLSGSTMAAIEARVVDLYQRHGFADAEVEVRRTTDPDHPDDEHHAVLAILIRSGDPLRVVGVSFPGSSFFQSDFLRDQIRSYLEEQLPHPALFETVDSEVLDALGVSGRPATAARSVPPIHEDLPNTVWYEPVYREAIAHIFALYESEGFLSAEIGEPELSRLDGGTAIVTIHVREGPRTLVWNVEVEGNVEVTSAELLALSELTRGAAFSQLAVEEARRRMMELYHERGYLFVRVDAAPHLSEDASRAEVVFEVVERFQVRIAAIEIEGCVRTDPSLVRDELDFREGDVYRPSIARENEESLLGLGIFSSVRIAPDAPDLAEQSKTIVVTVHERTPQELGLSAGFGTGDGLRGAFDYAYRNLFGWGLSLTLRAQLAYQFFFQDAELEQSFGALSLVDRLERRITASLSIPHIPGVPNVRLALDLVHLRDNFRDFGLDKNGVVLAATWTPVRRLTLSVSGEIEQNDVGLFQRQAYEEFLQNTDLRTQRLLRVPEGESAIGSARLSAVLDLRNNAFTPTEGLYASATLEWARTFEGGDTLCAVDPHPAPGLETAPRTCVDRDGSFVRGSAFFSHFFKLSVTVTGYIPITEGWVVAIQARGGRVFHLESSSRTYPNRAYYLGGVDSMRGFLQDQVIPQDQLDAIESGAVTLPDGTIPVVRNGDFFYLLRVELRFPILGDLQGGVFADIGNVWANADLVQGEDLLRLRWTVGVGLRYATPVGPLAIDYGFNLSRRNELLEPFGAFHFSIGLF
jgi:outer membrane protein insertion porin family